jgi:hypothetical protein
MAELERELRRLPVDWPATPDLAARLELAPTHARRRRLAVAALVAAALVAAFAVPQSRSAILRFFHLGGVAVERVETLPAATERPLASGLGSPVDDAEAARVLGTGFLPRSHGTLYEQNGFVSTLLSTPEPALLSEFGSADMIKKLTATSAVEQVEVAPGVSGLWISGAPHAVFFPGASPRLAGNVLVWARDGVTYRLEGRGLDQPRALRVAREVLGTSSG